VKRESDPEERVKRYIDVVV